MPARIAAYMRRAKDRVGTNQKLADELARAGVLSEGRPYSAKTVSAWTLGDVIPSAVVLLATCSITKLSLDEAAGLPIQPVPQPEALEALQRRVERLEARVAVNEGHIRQSEPPARFAPKPGAPY